MTRALPPVLQPIQIRMKDGVVLTTTINPSTQKHEVQCDLCQDTIILTVTGHPRRAQTHRHSPKCNASAAKKGLPVIPYTSVRAQNEILHRLSPAPMPDTSEMEVQSSAPLVFVVPPPPPTQHLFLAGGTKPCPGLTISWTPGSIWTTYPYQMHATRSPGWIPEACNEEENTITLRSTSCSKEMPRGDAPPCLACLNIQYSVDYREFRDRAVEALEHTPWEYLTADQTRTVMKKMASQLKQLRTTVNNFRRSNKVYIQSNEEYKRLMMMIASKEIAGLKRLLNVALRRGASTTAIIELIQKSMDGLYSPRGGFSNRDLDIAFIVKAIGGPRLLFALQKSHGLASRSTVHRYQQVPRLLCSVSTIKESEVTQNISSFLNPEVKPPPTKTSSGQLSGNILMFDDVALEGRCRFCSRRNHIIGLCREHGQNVNTEVTSIESIEKVRSALFDPDAETKVCFGTNATVVALAPYARADHYSPIPILASPSDKSEKADALAAWIKTVLQSYQGHKFGEDLNGKIWAIGSDGDATFRRAKHLLCMSHLLSPSNPLHHKLSGLRGLNLYTSSDLVLGTCDPKHIFKRFATLLRNTLGVMIFETNLRPHDIILYLSKLPEMSVEKARQLLDPSDKQNVPKAVSLLQNLSKSLPESAALSSSEEHRRDIITFFAKMLGSFLEPFILIEMNLSDQMASLSKYAHLAAALQIKHGSACLTGALYADSQAVVKNIFFTVARLQLLDKNLCFYLIQEGTDRLEGLFSDCRTQDHARNFDIEQLCSKLGVATLLNAAFERNPDLDQGHRRLNLKNALGVDHVNPKSWLGNTGVDVDLSKAWEEGRTGAVELLQAHFGAGSVPDFSALFSKAGFDLLRPAGEYVGIKPSKDDERSESDTLSPTARSTRNGSLSSPHTPNHPAPIGTPCECDVCTPTPQPDDISESDDSSDSEEQLRTSAVNASVVNSLPDNTDDSSFTDTALGMDVDDYFPDTDGTHLDFLTDHEADSDSGSETSMSPDLSSGPVAKVPLTILVNGKPVLKSSAVAMLSSNRSKHVTMRTLRAAGAVLEDFQSSKFSNLFDPAVDRDVVMKTGDHGAILVRSNGKICLAILEVTNFLVGKEKTLRTSTEVAKLSDRSAQITVVGQLLELCQSVGDPAAWQWSKRYLQLRVDTTSKLVTRNQFVIEFPSTLIHPLGPSMIQQVVTPQVNERLSWQFNSNQLHAALEASWNMLNPDSDEIIGNIAQLPAVVNPNAIPYRDSTGNEALFIRNLPPSLVPKPKPGPKQKVPCFLCGANKPLQKMRDHIGHHILRSLRNKDEAPTLNQKVGILPCGFCGQSETCSTQLVQKKDGGFSILSHCPYHYEGMNYKAALRPSKSTPSTNVPIHCTLCPPSHAGDNRTVWKYNMIYHLLTEHTQLEASGAYHLPFVPAKLMLAMFITMQEESWMGIEDEVTETHRAMLGFPGSSVVGGSDYGGTQLAIPRPHDKRGRSETMSSAGGGRKRRKDGGDDSE